MPVIGIDTDETQSLEIDGTIFKIGVAKSRDRFKFMQIAQSARKKEDGSVDVDIEKIFWVIKKGLVSIEKITLKGKETTVNTIDDDLLDLIPIKVLISVYNSILEWNIPQEEEVKN